MSTGRLQEFATSVTARGQLTFGDVRRLQRDCLPGGITNREDAELLIALSDTLVRADKAWAEWLVAALARYVVSRERSDVSLQDAAKAWLESLPAPSPAATRPGRRIGRQIRRELLKIMAPETEPAQPAAEPRPAPIEQPCPAPALGTIRRRNRPSVTRRKRPAAPQSILPVEAWSAGTMMMERHQRFQLERPFT